MYLEEFQREQDVQLSAVRSEAGRLETLLAERNQEVSPLPRPRHGPRPVIFSSVVRFVLRANDVFTGWRSPLLLGYLTGVSLAVSSHERSEAFDIDIR